jgi:hypothetical protein
MREAESMTYSVDPMDVLLPILRTGLPGVHVFSRVPDPVPDYLPLVVIRRTGGSSDHPDFIDVPWINVQCWAAPTPATMRRGRRTTSPTTSAGCSGRPGRTRR